MCSQEKLVSDATASLTNDEATPFSEAQATQEEIASICMDILLAKDSEMLANSLDTIEIDCFKLFKLGRHVKHTAAYRTIIDGLLSLLSVSPSYKRQLLSCCLLLCCCSVTRWIDFLRSGILYVHAEIAMFVVEAMTCTSSTWADWNHRDQELIAQALMDLSIPVDFEAMRSIVATAYASPLMIAISECLSCISKSETGCKQNLGPVLRALASRAPLEAWESIRNEDLLELLQFLPEADVRKELKLMYLVRTSWYWQERQRLLKSENICSEAALQYLRETEAGPSPILLHAKEDKKREFENVKFIVDAYIWGRKWKEKADEGIFRSAVAVWLEEKQPELVAAAYVAAPSTLRSMIEENPAMHSYIENLPKGLWSGLDESIDTHLAGLLESIPEIADVYGVRINPKRDYESRQLRRAAILYPFLMLRRTEDLCAAGKVILCGLSSPSEGYSESSLSVLALLLEIVSELPYASSGFRKVMSAFMVQVFSFVIAEGRLSNGIPKQLEALAVNVFKNIQICTKDDVERSILGLMPKLIETNKHNEVLVSPLRNFKIILKQRNYFTGLPRER